MPRLHVLVWTLGLLALSAAAQNLTSEKAVAPSSSEHARNLYDRLPLSFEPNLGQADAAAKFLAHTPGYTFSVTADEVLFAGRDGSVERMKVLGANRRARIEFLDKQPGVSSYFVGSDPAKWRTNIANYGKVALRGVYPGIDLVFYGHDRRIEYDWVLAPGADVKHIRMKWEGAGQVRSSAGGDLVLSSALSQKKPVILQDGKPIRGEYLVRGKEIQFKVAKYDASKPLLIDPVFIYSTYLSKGGFGIALDSAGNVYVAGNTGGSSGGPCVTKINASGSAVLYSTCLGGGQANGIAVDNVGNVYVTGLTFSTNLPTVNPLQATNHDVAGGNAFVTKIDPTGASLVYSTYLGGSGSTRIGADGETQYLGDWGHGIAVDSSGNAYVTGQTYSADFPSSNALQATNNGSISFVTKINASGTAFVYSTYLGGAGSGIAVDSAGNAYVAGGGSVTKINPSGSALVYAMSFGGSGCNCTAAGIAVDSAGNAYVTGSTRSTNFPTVNPFQATNHSQMGGMNAFVTKINQLGSAVVYSSYLGGSDSTFGGGDSGTGIAVDSAGQAYVTGTTTSTDFPTINALQPSYGGGITDVFVTKINAAGSALLYSTYLGGAGNDTGYAIAVDSNRNAYVTGGTGQVSVPNNFPTVNPLQGSSPSENSFISVIGTPLVSIATGSPTIPGVVGLPYTNTLTATDGVLPYTWSASGLPTGLILDPSTGVLSGIPMYSVSTTFMVTVTDAQQHSSTSSLAITVIAACTYELNPGGQSFPATGGSGTIGVIAPSGCAWSEAGGQNWISFSGSTSGTGNGTLAYQVQTNAGADRISLLTVAGLPFTIEQQAANLGSVYIGSMPHLAAEENWTTSFTLVNKGSAAATASLSFFGDPSDPLTLPDPSGALTLPLTFPQQPAAPNPLLAASFDQTISPNASLIVQTAGPQIPPVRVGSAQLAATGAIDGFAIFHHVITQQETVVPLETRNAKSYLLAFDNTGGSVLGVAVATGPVHQGFGYGGAEVVIRDDSGSVLTDQTFNFPAGPNEHTSFVLPTRYPVTANIRGTIQINPPSGGQISVLGMRFTPPNNALTTIPPLLINSPGGGSIAHIATGNGWQSTVVLVNTGTAAAPFQLNFFAAGGSPLALPIGFPQTTSGSTTVASSVSQTLAAGASLLIQSAAPLSDPAPTIGSAQLTTSGNVTGFVIYRYNPNGQEAVVPFENRNASGYILAFDNTAGTATGVAVNNATSQAADVQVVIRDDAGNQIAADTLHLAANGNVAFTLVADKYAATANIRGTIEFDTPPGGQIGALAFRIPVAHTFTTLPALTK